MQRIARGAKLQCVPVHECKAWTVLYPSTNLDPKMLPFYNSSRREKSPGNDRHGSKCKLYCFNWVCAREEAASLH